jgi:hypothetical protein
MNPAAFYRWVFSFLFSLLLPLVFLSDVHSQKTAPHKSKSDSRYLDAMLSLAAVKLDGNLEIKEYSSNPTVVLVDSKFWQLAGSSGRTSLMRDLVTFFQGKQLEGRYDYVSVFAVFDNKSHHKLAQGDVKTGQISVFDSK